MGITSAQARAYLGHLPGEPPPAKRRRKPGTGDFAERKRWYTAMRLLPGVFVPIRTVNELNDHGHFRWRQKRASAQHDVIAKELHGKRLPPLPIRVEFTRYSPGTCDSDGAIAAMKFVRDSVALHYRVDDNDPRIEWAYPVTQERAKWYGVRIEVTPRLGQH
jgi:hypothetical protein